MKASEARVLSDTKRKRDFLGYIKEGMEGENPEEFLGSVVKALVGENILSKTKEGRLSIMMEPFASIPGKWHPPELEDKLMKELAGGLEKDGYQDVTWDRRDTRVVLQFKW